MHDHPILGAVLFSIGAAIAGLAIFGSFEGVAAGDGTSSMFGANIIALNGVLLVILGSRKLDLARAQKAT